MRKRLIDELHHNSSKPIQDWWNVEALAEVELSSEDMSHPIESALLPTGSSGWRAAAPGSQTIRLVFDNPQSIHRIRLNFVETDIERTQEYVLRWSSDRGQSFREIVRQQWNFSPSGQTSETEIHHIDLENVTVLELIINPDIANQNVIASLNQWWIA